MPVRPAEPWSPPAHGEERIQRLRWVVPVAALLMVLGLLLAAAALGQQLAAVRELPGLPEPAALDLAVERLARVPPIRPAAVQVREPTLPEPPAPVRPDETPPTAHRQSVLPTPTPPPDGRPRSAPDQDRRSSPPSSPPRPLTPTSGSGDWDLRIVTAASRATARAGDEIVYSITVLSEGASSFQGDLNVDSHVPFGTTSRQPVTCHSGGAGVDVDSSCRSVVVPTPGPPSSGARLHQVSFRAARVELPPGAALRYSFAVTVSPGIPAGTPIENHAHLEVAGTRHAESSDTVTVTTT